MTTHKNTDTMKKRKGSGVIEVYSPADGERIGAAPSYDKGAGLDILAGVRAAQEEWSAAPHGERRKALLGFLEELCRDAEEVARLLSRESGKTLYESYVFEVVPLMHLTAYFARRAEKILSPRKIPVSLFKHRASYVHYRPRGVVFIVSPWNFPLTIPTGETVMALLAGNGVLLKPASLTPLIAHKVRELFVRGGLPPDLFQVVSGPGRMASELIEEGGIDYVNFTGSTEVGRKVSELCGGKLIPCTMELGGKDPAIVCEDADLDLAAGSVVWGAFANSGQICASVERAYVMEGVYERFVEKAVAMTKSIRQGDPLGDEVDMGAMVDPGQIEVVEEQVRDAVEKGARVLTGGRRPERRGNFFEPTIIVDATEEMKVVREESFGPLLPIMKVASEEEAVGRANDSVFGLSAYVYSSNGRRARAIAERLEAGTVMINEALITHGLPETPWGGVKMSGMGRVHSDDGLRDLSVAYHVNYDRLPLRLPFSYPYTSARMKRFLALGGFLHRPAGLREKLKSLKGLAMPD